MKFSAKGIAITLTISIILTATFLFFEINKNVKELYTIMDAIAMEMSGAQSFEEGVQLPVTQFGYEYEISTINNNEKVVYAKSDNFGSRFFVSNTLSLNGNEVELSLHMKNELQFFNVLTVILFFIAIQGIGFAIIAPSQSEKKSREILYDITYKDSLTGAFNKKRLMRFYNARKLDSNAPFSMFYTDINDFVGVNEKYGRHTADEILKEFTKRLSSYVRDAILVRLDGDDFVVVITGEFTIEILDSIKERLDHAFSKPLVIHDVDINISVAVAHASFPREGISLEKLLAVCAERVTQVKKTMKG